MVAPRCQQSIAGQGASNVCTADAGEAHGWAVTGGYDLADDRKGFRGVSRERSANSGMKSVYGC